MLSNKVVITSAALFAALQTVNADSQEFGILSIRSGSSLQYSTALIDTDSANGDYYPISIGSSAGQPTWEYVVDEQGHLVANGTYYWGIIPNSDGQYGATTDVSKAIKGFSISDGNLASSLGYYFEAVPDGSTWDLYSKNSDGNNGNTNNNLGLALAAYTSTGFASDYDPSSSSNDSVSNTGSSASKNTTTIAPSSSHNSSSAAIATTSSAAAITTSSSAAVASTTAMANHTSTAANKTSSAASTSSHKNGAEVTKGSLSLLAMGLAGLFL